MSQSQIDPQNTSLKNTVGMPRWVKIVGILLLLMVIVMAALHLSGAHGPASHMSPAAQSETTSESDLQP